MGYMYLLDINCMCFFFNWPTGGWSMNRKELKLQQVIGKGEFGGK